MGGELVAQQSFTPQHVDTPIIDNQFSSHLSQMFDDPSHAPQTLETLKFDINPKDPQPVGDQRLRKITKKPNSFEYDHRPPKTKTRRRGNVLPKLISPPHNRHRRSKTEPYSWTSSINEAARNFLSQYKIKFYMQGRRGIGDFECRMDHSTCDSGKDAELLCDPIILSPAPTLYAQAEGDPQRSSNHVLHYARNHKRLCDAELCNGLCVALWNSDVATRCLCSPNSIASADLRPCQEKNTCKDLPASECVPAYGGEECIRAPDTSPTPASTAITSAPADATTPGPTTAGPTTAGPTTAGPTTAGPTTAGHTTAGPTTPGATTPGATTPDDSEYFFSCIENACEKNTDLCDHICIPHCSDPLFYKCGCHKPKVLVDGNHCEQETKQDSTTSETPHVQDPTTSGTKQGILVPPKTFTKSTVVAASALTAAVSVLVTGVACWVVRYFKSRGTIGGTSSEISPRPTQPLSLANEDEEAGEKEEHKHW
eukprot:GHVQ01006040.1.p1 GENE.GHVQ01006040.1~~GHVQ01006040.1.p1  ORF type:complete len:505 (-),score=62.04 GHVQ01006040.1:449-1897(-)